METIPASTGLMYHSEPRFQARLHERTITGSAQLWEAFHTYGEGESTVLLLQTAVLKIIGCKCPL